ncbi:methyltransferase-like 26 isoform X2 [Macaca thibetana thibetana]|uniref:methyltransferase-like 26 isoform X2 n=1 Tax=Macaca thibetana thibetana TaxID=257877 RepID=UPI0021BC6F09|nr:methyltransferase-like 26 isoform X2 [Macaca thibetana thibetana]
MPRGSPATAPDATSAGSAAGRSCGRDAGGGGRGAEQGAHPARVTAVPGPDPARRPRTRGGLGLRPARGALRAGLPPGRVAAVGRGPALPGQHRGHHASPRSDQREGPAAPGRDVGLGALGRDPAAVAGPVAVHQHDPHQSPVLHGGALQSSRTPAQTQSPAHHLRGTRNGAFGTQPSWRTWDRPVACSWRGCQQQVPDLPEKLSPSFTPHTCIPAGGSVGHKPCLPRLGLVDNSPTQSALSASG